MVAQSVLQVNRRGRKSAKIISTGRGQCLRQIKRAEHRILRSDIVTSEMKMNTTPTRISIGNFNFIRTLAAILVIFGHSYALTGNLEPSFFGIFRVL